MSLLGHLPLTGKGSVGCSALSSLKNSLFFEFFDFSIFEFSIFAFLISSLAFWFLLPQIIIWDIFLRHFYTPDTSGHVVSLDLDVHFVHVWKYRKIWPFIFPFSEWFLTLLLTIPKFESMKLNIGIIAKMYLEDIENGLHNNFQVQHWSDESI